MKISLAISLAVLVIVAFLACAMLRQNDAAGYGQAAFGYPAYILGSPQQSSAIMVYWQRKPERVAAVQQLIYFGYAFMLVACAYLCLVIQYHRKQQKGKRPWLRNWLLIGSCSIIAGTIIGFIRDWLVYRALKDGGIINGLPYYSYASWVLLLTGIIPLVIAVLPADLFSKQFLARSVRFLSQLLKSVWLFFPGILFLLFPIFCFWTLGQGKDIIVAFIDNRSGDNPLFSFNYFRLIFFIAIGFWIYVSWYSSRTIAYIKKKQQLDLQQRAGMDVEQAERLYEQNDERFEISKRFLEEVPRVIGNSCFLVLELAVLQSPVLYTSISITEAWIFFIISLILLWHINQWITGRQSDKPGQPNSSIAEKIAFRKLFWWALGVFVFLILLNSFIDFKQMGIWVLFILLLLFHLVFVLYINLRRVEMEKTAALVKAITSKEVKERRSILQRSMDYFCIPRKEIGYYRWFLWICGIGILLYILAIWWLGFARALGPFPFIILAFGVLLSFGNIVTAFSIRYKLNFHFLLFILALLFGLKETHEVRTIALKENNNQYTARPDLKTYLTAWLSTKKLSSDSCYDMYFVMSNGGASRSGYWTAAVLGKIEDSTLVRHPGDRFSDHVFCLSGTSGGGVGVATFFSLLRNRNAQRQPWYTASAQSFLRQDYFTYTFARMLGPDFFNYIFHVSAVQDRAAALESSFEASSLETPDSTYTVPFADRFSAFPAMKAGGVLLPILFVNTTRMQDGSPGVVTNLNINVGKPTFNGRVDVVKLLAPGNDISITSGAILGARFPYLSPAGRIANDYFVDGGYFDNSGAGVVQELIRGILTIAKEDATGKLREQIRRLNFKIMHIVNSPVGFESAGMESVAPVKNDLMSPILTIGGAYNKQTTVNDGRLTNYITDINRFEANRASYTQVSLYKSPKEWWYDPLNKRFRGEPSYSMNWFMSDTTARRIDNRLGSNPVLDSLIRDFNRPAFIKNK